MALPVVHLTGSPRDRGVLHGRELKDRIAHNLDVYYTRFEREVGLSKKDARALAEKWAEAIFRQNPTYFAEMEGVAVGSQFDLRDIAALNVRYEILYYLFGKQAAEKAKQSEIQADGCTAFAVLPEGTQSGHLLMGQNWDWIPEVQGAVLHTTESDGLETLAYTESGIVGAKIGLNSEGLGLAINGMTTLNDDWESLRKPFHVRCYEILRSKTIEDAIKVVTDENRSCAANFLIAQAPNKVVDIEAAPDKYGLLTPDDACLTHANHFVDPEGLGVAEAPNDRRIYSKNRQNRLRELLLERLPVTVETIQDALRDTQDEPFGICRHRNLEEPPELHYTTVTSVVMDLHTRTVRLTDGTPDESPYQTVALSRRSKL
ncbi:MAG: C45 family autoproteolytic acyltransferase/hydolase [Armatimonadaceae bacterium]